MRKEKVLVFFIFILSFVAYATPLYNAETIPSPGENLGNGVSVVFTVPTDVNLAFSTDSELIIDPGTTELTVDTNLEDSSFYVVHDDLYALWDIATSDDSAAFKIYLYLTGPLKGTSDTSHTLDWTVTGGHSTVGGTGKYCSKPEDINDSNSIEIASGRKKSYEKISINIVDISNKIINVQIPEDTYTGSICLYYKEG